GGETSDTYPVLNNTHGVVYAGYQHEGTTPLCSNSSSYAEENKLHAHAYDANATTEANGNHDKSYQDIFNWADNDDKTDATVTATFTCSVCGKVETPELTAVHDDEHPNTPAACTEVGYNYFKTSHAFAGAIFTDSYKQTVPVLGHNMTEITFNEVKKIYSNQCQREGCGHTDYYATSNGSVVANETSGGFVAEALTLEDATAYDNKAVFTATNFTYTRTFSNTNWTTWYVPFELTLTKDICDKFAFSRINNVHQYDTDNDGNADRTVVESFRQTEGVTLKANYPYLVKPVSENDLNMVLNLTNVQPALAEAQSIDCQSVDYKYVFKGTYNGEGASGSTLYDPYTLHSDGTWQHYYSLKPMRHYLTISSRNATTSSAAFMRSILLSVIGDENATGIVKIYDEERRAKETYDLGGRRIPAGSQRNGFYIENG
ncbi:hypothetical protein CIK99_06765, partial [Prevotella sp. P5-92]|uniref:hypothetical protein n=1 Tax=Prevotella sp. P5-92 TaxID=2024222 RepID=UPI000BC3F8B2